MSASGRTETNATKRTERLLHFALQPVVRSAVNCLPGLQRTFTALLSVSARIVILNRLQNAAIWIVCATLTSGCASSPSEYQVFASKPTPQIWLDQSTWQFHIVGPDGNWLGSIDLTFGQEKIDTCNSGEWRKATLLRATADVFGLSGPAFTASGGNSQVAYSINGATLRIDLHARLCDSNSMLQGRLLETGSIGRVYHSTMVGGSELGSYTAAPIVTNSVFESQIQ